MRKRECKGGQTRERETDYRFDIWTKKQEEDDLFVAFLKGGGSA